MDFWSGIGHNVEIFYHNLTVFWLFSWGVNRHSVLLSSSNTHSASTSTPQIFSTSISYTAVSSHVVPYGNVLYNSAETLNVVSYWHISIETYDDKL